MKLKQTADLDYATLEHDSIIQSTTNATSKQLSVN